MKRLMPIILMLLTTALVSTAFAQQGQNRPMKQGNLDGQGLRWMESMSDMTEDQKSKITDIHLEAKKNAAIHQSEMLVLRAELQQIRLKDPSNIKAINQKIDQITAKMATQMKAREAAHQKIRNLLTDDQKKVFDLHVSQMMQKGGQPGRMHGEKPGMRDGKRSNNW